MKWTGVLITTTNEAIEAITYMLYDIGVKGVEILDNTLTEKDKENLIVDYIDDNMVNNKEIKIKCYFSEEENINEIIIDIKQRLNNIKKFIDIGSAKIETDITDEEDWANNWKQFYKPFKVGNNILIKPTWEKIEEYNDKDIIIEIDPGMAFGSGTHETTSMCIELIQTYLNERNYIIDVGCGSGILGITAAKLGAEKVDCIDIDKNAVKVAKSNVSINDEESKVSVIHGDLIDKVSTKADIVVANIMADIVILLTKDIKKVLKKEGVFISSGIILDKLDEVKNTILANKFEILDIKTKGEWAAIAAKSII